MIIIKGKSEKSIKLANYINNNIGNDKKIVMFDSVKVPYLQLQIKKEYEHYIIEHSFEDLLNDLDDSNAEEIIKQADIIVFECNISEDQLSKLDESKYSQEIIVTVQSDDETKIFDTKNTMK